MVKYEKLFGLDAQTGIDLPGEAAGFLPSKDWKLKTKGEAWYIAILITSPSARAIF